MGREGSVLVPVLVVCIVFAATLGAQYRESRLEMMINNNLYRKQKLFYLAEAGMVKGFYKLREEPGWRSEENYYPLGPEKGFFLETREKECGQYLISRGYEGGEEFYLTAKFQVSDTLKDVELLWWKEGLP